MLEDIKKSYDDLNQSSIPVPLNHDHNNQTNMHKLRVWLHRVALSGVMLAIYCGVLVGLIPALKDALFRQTSVIR